MYHIIVNPASRSGKGGLIWKELEPVLKERNLEYEVLFSKESGHAAELVSELSKAHPEASPDAPLKLLVLGGDGTFNEVLQGISDFNVFQIGYIPSGSSNDLARDLNLPSNPHDCLNNILDCKTPYRMDLGCVTYNNTSGELSRLHGTTIMNPRYFDVSSGIGYDAAICEEALASPIKKVLNRFGLGKLVYLIISLKQLITTKAKDATLILDDKTEIKLPNLLFAAFMIHRYEGGGFMFAPDADCTDGVIDICAVSNISKPAVLATLPKALKGKHFNRKGIEKYSASKIEITVSEPYWVHTDGEVSVKSSSLTITCIKEAINLLK